MYALATRPADPAVRHELDRGLDRAAEECVGCAPEAHPRALRSGKHLASPLEARGKRLLAPHVLARSDRCQARVGVRERRGQIHHQLDVAVRHQPLGGARPRDAVLSRLVPRPTGVEVRARHDLEQL
jgi:hypothetical protein